MKVWPRLVGRARAVYIVFDYDEKPTTRSNVDAARQRLAKALVAAGAGQVYSVDIPPGSNNTKQGVDDYLVANGADKFRTLVAKAKLIAGGSRQVSHDSRVSRVFTGHTGGVVAGVEKFISTYIVLPESAILVLSVWVVAAWLAEKWDRLAHLAITSPEKPAAEKLGYCNCWGC